MLRKSTPAFLAIVSRWNLNIDLPPVTFPAHLYLMKEFLISPLLFLSPLLAQEDKKTPTTISPEESTRRSSLVLGHQEGVRTAQQQIEVQDIETEAYLEGFLLGLKAQPLTLSSAEIREAMTRLQEKLTERDLRAAEANLQGAKEFLAENEKQEDVLKSDSGLQYRVLKPGVGEPFGEAGLSGKEIYVNYQGTLPDGTAFSTSDKTAPTQIQLDDLISGFRESLVMMKKGEHRMVYIPPEFAYGDQRRSNQIGPNQLLIFEIELVDVRDPPPPPE